MREKRISE
jgi:ATP-dependent DNA helicase RecG